MHVTCFSITHPNTFLVYEHWEFLNGWAFKPFYGLGGTWVKPRVRVKMGRRTYDSDGLRLFAPKDYHDPIAACLRQAISDMRPDKPFCAT